MRNIVLLILKEKGNIKLVDMPAIQARAYLLSRLIQRDYGFSYNYYCLWSTKLYNTIVELNREGLIEMKLGSQKRTHYLLTELGEKELEEYEEREMDFLRGKLNKIIIREVFQNRNHLHMMLIMDYIAQKIGGREDRLRLMYNLRALGWHPSPSAFNLAYNSLSRVNPPYKKEVPIVSRGKN